MTAGAEALDSLWVPRDVSDREWAALACCKAV